MSKENRSVTLKSTGNDGQGNQYLSFETTEGYPIFILWNKGLERGKITISDPEQQILWDVFDLCEDELGVQITLGMQDWEGPPCFHEANLILRGSGPTMLPTREEEAENRKTRRAEYDRHLATLEQRQ